MKLTSAIMRAAARRIEPDFATSRSYFVCFCVEDAAAALNPTGTLCKYDRDALRQQLEALLTRDGISIQGQWFRELDRNYGFICTDTIPGYEPPGPERQKLRVQWCEKIADELEAQENGRA